MRNQGLLAFSRWAACVASTGKVSTPHTFAIELVARGANAQKRDSAIAVQPAAQNFASALMIIGYAAAGI